MNDNKDVAVQITDLKKKYRLGVIGGGTLQGDIQSWWAKKRGKEDPNLKIGQKEYGKNETFMALNGIDLTVKKGERLGIIGHNGAGKSTLLKLLSRVTAPTEGKICIDGRISSMLEVGTGFNPELTGRENIYLNGAILGMSKSEVDSKIDEIIEFSECGQFIDTPVKRYSSGMYVKLAFSVAAHLDSEILIMDEVLAVGDMKFQQKCLGKMSDVSEQQGRTVLYVSHNMNTVRRLCTRCVVLSKGKVIFDGDVEAAIEIYMQDKEITQDKKIDLSIKERPEYMRGTNKIELQSFEILNHSDYIFKDTDKLEFNLKWKTKEYYKKIGLRCEFRYADGTGVTTSFIEDIGGEFSEGNWEKDFSIDLSYFTPGKYTVTIVPYHENEITKKSIDDDIIINAFSFEIEQSDMQVMWNVHTWGHVKLDILGVKG